MMPMERRKSDQPYSGPERRKGPGRPPLTDEERAMRPKPRNVRLDAETDNRFCLLSSRHGISINALLRLGARRIVADDERGVLDLSAFSVDE